MNIHIITSSYPAYPDDPTGTAGLFVRQFALELAERGHRVIVQPTGTKPEYEPEEGLTVVPAPWLGGDQELASMNLLNPINWLVFVHYFLRGIRSTLKINSGYAIEKSLCMWAVPSGVFGLAGKMIQNIPYDVWVLGSDIWKIRKIPLLGKLLLKIVMKHADRVFADGLQLAEDVEQITGVPCKFLPSSRKLPPPNTKMFTSGSIPLTHFLYVGRYHVNKGPDLLIRAIACLPRDVRESLQVDLFGFGPLHEELLRLVVDLGVDSHVQVRGPIRAQEFSNYLDSVSFLVIPSRIESIPVVFSDSLQMATPTVSMPVGDLGTYIQITGCGIVAEDVSPEAFATAIMEAMTRGKESFREGVAKAYEPFKTANAVCTWLDM